MVAGFPQRKQRGRGRERQRRQRQKVRNLPRDLTLNGNDNLLKSNLIVDIPSFLLYTTDHTE